MGHTRARLPRLPRERLTLILFLVVPLTRTAPLRSQVDPNETTGLVRGPYLQALLQDSVEIIWATRGLADRGGVRFAPPDGEMTTISEDAEFTCRPLEEGETCRRVRIGGLASATEYRYEILSGDEALSARDVYHFRTPPPRGEGIVRLAALGDSGVGTPDQKAVADVIAAFGIDGIVHTGDVDYGGPKGDRDDTTFGPYAEIFPNACFFPAKGNHDTEYDTFEDQFFLPGEPAAGSEDSHFSFDWGSAHFTIVNTTIDLLEEDGSATEQLRWLCADLEAARASGTRWLIVAMHEPMFSVGPQGSVVGAASAALPVRTLLAPLFDAHAVDLVLMGDDHNYQRSRPITMAAKRGCGEWIDMPCDEEDPTVCYEVREDDGPWYTDPGGRVYIVTGGGGRWTYPKHSKADERINAVFYDVHHAVELTISPAMLQLRAVDREGEEIDRFSIADVRARRGDMDFDGNLSIADAIATLQFLFVGTDVECPQVGDTNDDHGLSIVDPIYVLNHLFGDGPPPAPPYPECGRITAASSGFCRRNGC